MEEGTANRTLPLWQGDNEEQRLLPGFRQPSSQQQRRKGLIIWGAIGAFLVLLIVLAATHTSRSSAGDELQTDTGPSSLIPSGISVVNLVPQPGEDWRGHPRRISVAKGGVVAADQSVCSDIGAAVLAEGGNAVDAAVATCLCQGVHNPFASGIGGGFFATIRAANGTSEFIDARELAPGAASRDMYTGKPANASLDGPLAIAVPLELKGLELAWRRYGRLPWARLVRPAAQLAREGITTNPYLYYVMSGPFTYGRLKRNPLTAEAYLIKEAGGTYRLPRVGEKCCVRPKLAETLEGVAHHGAQYVYNPKTAATIAEELQRDGGIMSAADLVNAQPVITPLLELPLGDDLLIYAPPPPSSASIMTLALRILAGFPTPSADSPSEPQQQATGGSNDSSSSSSSNTGNTTAGRPSRSPSLAQYTHWLIESMKHAFAVRLWLGDPGTPEHPYADVQRVMADITSQAFADKLRSTIRNDSVLPDKAYGGRWNPIGVVNWTLPEDHGTSHLCVVDEEGNAVALTTTVNTAFGSNWISPSTGILMNNEMDDFSKPDAPNVYGYAPAEPNFIAPGKRPLSSMSPIVITTKDGHLRMVAGASGGSRIISAVMQSVARALFLKSDPLAAVSDARIHDQFLPGVASYEEFVFGNITFHVPGPTLDFLETAGDRLSAVPGQNGNSQIIVIDPKTGAMTAACDPRKDGAPAAQPGGSPRLLNVDTQQSRHVGRHRQRMLSHEEAVQANLVGTAQGHVDG